MQSLHAYHPAASLVIQFKSTHAHDRHWKLNAMNTDSKIIEKYQYECLKAAD